MEVKSLKLGDKINLSGMFVRVARIDGGTIHLTSTTGSPSSCGMGVAAILCKELTEEESDALAAEEQYIIDNGMKPFFPVDLPTQICQTANAIKYKI